MLMWRSIARFQSTIVKPALNPNLLDLRVGLIKSIARHENADSLYVSQIEIHPNGSTVQVCSGLVGLVPIEELQSRRVVLVNNLKPSKMRGVKSEAMLLCAASEGDKVVEPVMPDPKFAVGHILKFTGIDNSDVAKKRIKSSVFANIAAGLSVDSQGQVIWTKSGSTDTATTTTTDPEATTAPVTDTVCPLVGCTVDASLAGAPVR